MIAQTFCKRPRSVIQAFQFSRGLADLTNYCPEQFSHSEVPPWLCQAICDETIFFSRHEGVFYLARRRRKIQIELGDWIVLTAKGEFQVWPSDDFESEFIKLVDFISKEGVQR